MGGVESGYLSRYLKTPGKDQKSSVIAVLAALDHLKSHSPTIAKLIIDELNDQRASLKLIASENYSSLATQLAMGNWLTDKYAEGYPYHRFYAGCTQVDAIEDMGAKLAAALFEADFAYMQPHSGADANLVAFYAILAEKIQSPFLEKLCKKSPDELTAEDHEGLRKEFWRHKLMGLALGSGGHLTHGFRNNISSKLFDVIPYHVNRHTHLFDYDEINSIAHREKPLILLVGYSAYSRLIDFAKMREIADSVGAILMVDMAHFAGLVAGKVFQGPYNPIKFADIVTSTTHKTLRGPRGGLILAKNQYKDSINRGCPYVLGGPLPHVLAAKAIALQEASTPDFQKYARQVVINAQALAHALQKEGIKILTGGTDNHLMVIDLTDLKITGRQAENILRKANLTVNRNMIPFDPQGAWYTSGIRIGTPAMTTLGMGIEEMKVIAGLIATVLKSTIKLVDEKTQDFSRSQATIDEKIRQKVSDRVKELLTQFPLYPEIPLDIN